MTEPVPVAEAERIGPLRRVLIGAARRVGCTEGQIQTVVVGLAVALVGAGIGIPPVLDDDPVAAAATPTAAATATTTNAGSAPAPAPTPVSGGGTPSRGGGGGGTTTAGRPGPDHAPEPATPLPPGSPRPTPPSTPEGEATEVGVPGVNGACSVEERSIDNPRQAEGAAPTLVWIFEPAGAADATITGGRCDDDRRPAVFFAHGFGQTDPTAYEVLIEHLVSVGNVVVFPVYNVNDGNRATLEESYRIVDTGFVTAVEATPRIDTSRAGWWGHSNGGGMIPYLVQQGSARGWGDEALWMSIVAQAYTQLVGAVDIAAPPNAQAMTVAFDQDALADARLGIDVFESLLLPDAQKRHVTVRTGTYDGRPFVADHGAPAGASGQADAVDVLLWRYADLLEICALHGQECGADLATAPDADGTPQQRAVVSSDPVDVGPAPAVLAECDAVFGPMLNPRIARCGPSRI